MNPRPLLILTAALEATAGLALLAAPSVLATTLLGTPLESAGTRAVARIGGAALLSLGVICWAARTDAGGRAARGIVGGVLLYNIGVVAVVVHGAAVELHAIGLWPAAALHTALAAWCLACLTPRRSAGRGSVTGEHATTRR